METTQDPQDLELSFAATRPFDFHAWLTTWQREFVFFRVDARNRINYMAPSVRDILGYDPETMLGRDYHEYFDVEDPMQAQLHELSERMMGAEPPDVHRCVARRRNGDRAYFLLRAREVRGPFGVVDREMMGQDITVRIEAVLSLRQSERKYRRLVEGLRSEYIIYARDANDFITYASPSIQKVLGYSPDEAVGRHAAGFYGLEQAGQTILDHFRRDSQAGKVVHNYAGEFRHRNGGVRFLEVQERPIFAPDGRYAGMEGIARDVTEAAAAAREIRELKDELERRVAHRTEQLQRMNEELRASETRYRDVVETQTEFIIRWRPDGSRTFVNEAYARYLGRPAHELIGESFFPRVHSEDRARFDDVIASITPAHPSATYEVRGPRPDGVMAWMQWTTRGFFDADGQAVEDQAVGRDVTELREAADLLRQKESHLTHLSRLATAGEMVAGIAHEINQPLHAAKTFAEAARRHLQAGGAERISTAIDCTTEISEAISRTVQIIRRLREFTKAKPVELESLDVNAILREALELAAYEIRRSGVAVRKRLTERLPAVYGDRVQLEQLFVNLLVNACEAMAGAQPAERLLTIRTAAADGLVTAQIQDSGCGLREADAHRLFDAFYTTKKEGMGMGLSLCKSIAEAHGADLRFESNPDGPGLTFILTLPTSGAPFA
ncbi:MAG: PAS domain S-box protein [Pirellulales bacterium]|nr:PAS domain S-box protein [Pirellulales bacterium]